MYHIFIINFMLLVMEYFFIYLFINFFFFFLTTQRLSFNAFMISIILFTHLIINFINSYTYLIWVCTLNVFMMYHLGFYALCIYIY